MQHEVSIEFELDYDIISSFFSALIHSFSIQITDRYYKLGSSVDITCQVAISYLNTLPPSSTSSSSYNDIIVSQYPMTTTTTTTVFPFIDTNLIRRTFEQYIPYNGNHIIKWRKDGKDLPKDIKINLRLVGVKLLNFSTHNLRLHPTDIVHQQQANKLLINLSTWIIHLNRENIFYRSIQLYFWHGSDTF